MSVSGFDLAAFTIIAFTFGALWGYYTGATKWRNRYYQQERNQ